MKQLISFLFSLVFVINFSQEKRIDFTKIMKYEVSYKKPKNSYRSPKLNFTLYASNNQEFLTIGDFNRQNFNFFTDQQSTSVVNITLNNKLATSSSLSFFNMYRDEADAEVFTQKFAASPLKSSETILGIPCNNYILKPIFVSNEESKKEENNFIACINENYPINNFKVLSSIFNTIEPYKKVDFNISGLILKLGPEKTYKEEYLALTSMENTKEFVVFDHHKSLAEQKTIKDSLIAERKKWETLYADSAATIVDSVAVAAENYIEKIPNYTSTYKIEPKRDTMNLAVSNDYSKSFLNGIPKYCAKIDKEIPKFEMKDLDYHVKNYVGQTCDMYLAQSRDHNVAIKITLDEIRREALFLMRIREKLSERDRKKLDKYLDDLD